MGALEQYGETEATIPELEELQNARERLTAPSRLHTLLLRILESQPLVSPAILNLLVKTIEQARAATEAARASVREKQLEPTMTQPPKIPAPQTRKRKLSGCVKATDSWSKSLWHWMN